MLKPIVKINARKLHNHSGTQVHLVVLFLVLVNSHHLVTLLELHRYDDLGNEDFNDLYA
jgi:hypothetical protein